MHRDYAKRSDEQLDVLIGSIQADAGRIKLLQVLGTQLEQLVIDGHPDLLGLYDALNEQELASQEELQNLRTRFTLDSVSRYHSYRDMLTKENPFHSGCASTRNTECRRRQLS